MKATMKGGQKLNLAKMGKSVGGLPMPQTFSELVEFSKIMSNSFICPNDIKGNWQSCMMLVLQGSEIGFGPCQSLSAFSIIHGKPALKTEAIVALVMASGKLEYINEQYTKEGMVSSCVVKRIGHKEICRTFSIADAKAAGLTKNPLYQSYPKRMLGARAKSFALRDTFPDVIKGISFEEEVSGIDYEEDLDETKAVEAVKADETKAVEAVKADETKAVEAVKADETKAELSPEEKMLLLNLIEANSRAEMHEIVKKFPSPMGENFDREARKVWKDRYASLD